MGHVGRRALRDCACAVFPSICPLEARTAVAAYTSLLTGCLYSCFYPCRSLDRIERMSCLGALVRRALLLCCIRAQCERGGWEVVRWIGVWVVRYNCGVWRKVLVTGEGSMGEKSSRVGWDWFVWISARDTYDNGPVRKGKRLLFVTSCLCETLVVSNATR